VVESALETCRSLLARGGDQAIEVGEAFDDAAA
jgi:hypothetical protein